MASQPRAVTKEQIAATTERRVNRSSKRTPESMGAAAAKAQLLRLLDVVEREGKVITITKRGRTVAQLGPVEQKPDVSAFDQIFGRSRGEIAITGDIVSPDWEAWGPEWR